MAWSLMLLALAASNDAPNAAPPSFQPAGGVTAHATMRIRILSGVRFGEDHQVRGEQRRKGFIREPDGIVRSAELLEFQ